MVALPSVFRANRDYWQIKLTGAASYGKMYVYTHNPSAWRVSLANGLAGYPFGLPPGNYDITATAGTATQTWANVEVRSGEVTTLS
jgi:hypothetical protein